MAELLKETFFSREFVGELSGCLESQCTGFSKDFFRRRILNRQWKDLELKQRMRHVTVIMGEFLPSSYKEAIATLYKVAPVFEGRFEGVIFPDFVEVYGQDKKDWSTSLKALEFFTRYSTSEFAVRPFILQDPDRLMKKMLRWSAHKNEHVRRLASEGCRPRLPWGKALSVFKIDPYAIIPILEKLKEDPSLYVRKSVANNLNDISKDHPNLVLNLCKEWHGGHLLTNWIVKRGCRTLLKSGNKKALALFGMSAPRGVRVKKFSLSETQLSLGEDLFFNFTLVNENKMEKKLRVEFQIFFMKNNGKRKPKVFHVTESILSPGESFFSKKYSFKNKTTRRHYSGQHQLAILVNGEELKRMSFDVRNS